MESMNLQELKEKVDAAMKLATDYGDDPKEITVSIQVESGKAVTWSNDVNLHYDGDCNASGCVIVGDALEPPYTAICYSSTSH